MKSHLNLCIYVDRITNDIVRGTIKPDKKPVRRISINSQEEEVEVVWVRQKSRSFLCQLYKAKEEDTNKQIAT